MIRRLRRALVAVPLALSLAAPVGAQSPDEQTATVTMIEDRAAAWGQSGPRLVAVARCESHLNAGAVGAAGEQGLYQLHARGLRPLFFQWGYSDPFNAWESADFAARAFAAGLSSHWSCAR